MHLQGFEPECLELRRHFFCRFDLTEFDPLCSWESCGYSTRAPSVHYYTCVLVMLVFGLLVMEVLEPYMHGPCPLQLRSYWYCYVVAADQGNHFPKRRGCRSAVEKKSILNSRLESLHCHWWCVRMNGRWFGHHWVLMIEIWLCDSSDLLQCLHNFNFETTFESKWFDSRLSSLSEESEWPLHHQVWTRSTCISIYLHLRNINEHYRQ